MSMQCGTALYLTIRKEERSGSAVECLKRDREVDGWGLTRDTVLCLLASQCFPLPSSV